jgi:Protein of unknown function (DUF2752)
MTPNSNAIRVPVPAWAGIAGLVLALGGTVMLFLVDPAHCPFYPQCVFHHVTGWNCPGCGSLRAMHQLLHGHLLAALRDNVLLMLSLPVLAVYALQQFSRWLAGLPVLIPAVGARGIWLLFGVLLAFTIIRNIPVAPFIYLSPP